MALDDRHQRIYCVVDAFDECDQNGDQRSDLLRRLVKLFSKDNSRLKLFITSRPGERDIEFHLSSKFVLKFPLNAQNADLDIYVKSKVDDLPDYLFTEQLREQVQKKICAQAGGTFLWASLVMKQIAKLEAPSMYEVEKVFEESPSELDDLYYRLVARLTAVPVCAKVLAWVAYAKTPLTVDELRDAINFDPGQRQYKSLSEMAKYRPTITEEWIRQSLGTLLSVQKKNAPFYPFLEKDCVFFIHQSVKEFFHHRAETPLDSCGAIGGVGVEPDTYLARTCLFYLHAEEFREIGQVSMADFTRWVREAREGEASKFLLRSLIDEFPKLSNPQSFPFLAYASQSWYKHLRTEEQVEGEWDKVEALLDDEQPYLAVWIRGQWESGKSTFLKDLYREDGRGVGVRPTQVAIELDICWLTRRILDGRIAGEGFGQEQIVEMARFAPESFEYLCANRQDIRLPKAVLRALGNGHHTKRGIEVLLRTRTAEFEITEEMLEIAVAADNSSEGCADLVKLLLEKNKALTVADKCLREAARKPRSEILELILRRRGGKVDIVDELVIIAAGEHSGYEALKVLLKSFGDRITITKDLLITALYSCSVEVFRYLVEQAGPELKITEDILVAAEGVVYLTSNEMLEFLLETKESEIVFTPWVLQAFLDRCQPRSGKSMTLIFNQDNCPVQITEQVILSAIEWSKDTVPDALRWGEEVVDIMELLLVQKHQKIQMTEELMQVAAKKLPREQEMRSAVAMMPAPVDITEGIVTAAAANEECGQAILRFLFHSASTPVKITEGVLNAVVNNRREGKNILEWMLQEYPDRVDITRGVLFEAVLNPRERYPVFSLLMDRGLVPEVDMEDLFQASVMTWADSMEIFGHVKRKMDRYPSFSGQQDVEKRNKAAMETTKLLFKRLDTDRKRTEDLLISSAGDNAASLMLPLVFDDMTVAPQRGHEFVKFLKGAGFSTHLLAVSSSKNADWAKILDGFCRIAHQTMVVPDRTLIDAAASDCDPPVLPILIGDGSPCMQSADLARSMRLAAATNGQLETLNLLSKRSYGNDDDDDNRSSPDREHDRLVAVAQLCAASKRGDDGTVVQLLTSADPPPPDVPSHLNRAPLWHACVRGHFFVARALLRRQTRRRMRVDVGRVDGMGRTPLHWAAALDHWRIVGLLLEHGADPYGRDRLGKTPLGLAKECSADKAECALSWFEEEWLLSWVEERGVLNYRMIVVGGGGVWTPLHIAARGGRAAMVEMLLMRGDDAGAATATRETPLHLAALGGFVEVVRALLAKGADVEARDEDERTALHLAAVRGHESVARTLLDHGACVQPGDDRRMTPLHIASLAGHVDVVNVLLEKGADVNAPFGDQDTLLHLASPVEKERAIEALAQHKVCVSATEEKKRTPLSMAAHGSYMETVEALLSEDADDNAQDFHDRTALQYACEAGDEAVVRILLWHKANIDVLDEHDLSALHLAARKGHEKVVKILLEHGANPNIRDWDALFCAAAHSHEKTVKLLLDHSKAAGDGTTPLHYAIGYDLDTAKILYRAGADVKASANDGTTVWHKAVQHGQLNAVLWLTSIENGAQINAVDSERQTALHLAALYGHHDIADALLQAGASHGLQDTTGRTPLHWAIYAGHDALVELLLTRGANTTDISDGCGKTGFELIQQARGLHSRVRHLLPEHI
ncbi:ankyrin repeat protein [Diplodia corticola]|uniref:Ankyrin repeat protein n=1 Tax=Diplodia corticola TaxID=236234 RepID=A0A1J9S4G6_9PEZI|nr:ankyrin repeat protein [Diplodia corticola]OJD34860.1 ankyrin repeat protein [Diplodia corticola]